MKISSWEKGTIIRIFKMIKMLLATVMGIIRGIGTTLDMPWDMI